MPLVEDALTLRPKSVKELFTICVSRNPTLSMGEFLDIVKKLEGAGKMVLRPPRFGSLGKFLLSPYWNTDLYVVTVISMLVGFFYLVADEFPWSLFQIVPGLLLIFYLPGRNLLLLLLGKPNDMLLERMVLDIATSMVVVLLLGLLLNFIGLGLVSSSALGSLIALNIIFTLLVSYRDFSSDQRGISLLRAKSFISP